MEAINSFSNGQNSDVSKTILAKDSYLQALNFRPLTELGASNGSLVNIKGNECKISFPDLKPVFKLQLIKGTNAAPSNSNTVTMTINGFTPVDTLNISNTTLGLDIYNFIIANFPQCYQYTGTLPLGPTFAVAYEDDYVVFYQQPIYQDCEPVLSVTTEISNSYSGSTTGDLATLQFVEQGEPNTNLIQDLNKPYVSGFRGSGIVPIGSTFILNDIYILTAPDNNSYGPAGTPGELPEHDTFGAVGAIWKLNIDDITKQHTLTLIYSNNLDFTKYHPVAPSAIIGRYESNGIQRIYWTDFYNKIRNINVAKPQLMALSPVLLYVFPSVSFEIPLLKNIGGGNLGNGTYELAYRLKNTAGAVTNFSQTSNMVHILENDPNDGSAPNFIEYQGGVFNGRRSITWRVCNLDTQYDTVEYIILYRASKTDVPVIYLKTPEDNIGTAVEVDVTITDLTSYDTLTLDEYLALVTGFTHAKTVDTKDNRLFWGNVRYEAQSDISKLFDARAFRAYDTSPLGANNIKLTNNGINGPYTYNDAIATPQTYDNINEYYDSTGNESPNACFYKPGTSVLGGKGKFIEYEFGTEEILLSELGVTRGASNSWLINPTVVPPSGGFSNRSALSGITTPQDLIITPSDSDNQTYSLTGTSSTAVGSYKNPYVTSLLKGYQHEEIYRFGIQFFDLQGNPFFTEWIGDIKMPRYSDYNNNPGPLAIAAGYTDFRNSFLGLDGNIYGQVLYIKFDVNVDIIKKFISGYQIVRVERDETNKTILGSGIITQTRVDDNTEEAVIGGGFNYDPFGLFITELGPIAGIPYMPNPSQNGIETLCPDYSPTSGDGEKTNLKNILTYDSFDLLTNGYSFSTNDKLLVRSRVKPINRQRAMGGFSDPRYRLGFNNTDWLANASNGPSGTPARSSLPPSYNGTPGSAFAPFFNGSADPPGIGKWQTAYDSAEMPYYILFYVEDLVFNSTLNNVTNLNINEGHFANVGEVLTVNGTTFKNHMRSYGNPTAARPSTATLNDIPGYGSKTIVVHNVTGLDASIGAFNIDANSGNKLIALYYRPNINQYGGNNYAARTNSTYIACGSYIPLQRINNLLDNNKLLDFKCFGGDIHLNYWDHQKVSKNIRGSGVNPPSFLYYEYDSIYGTPASPGSSPNPLNPLVPGYPTQTSIADFNISVSYIFPCTNQNNQGVRYGAHIDHDLNVNTYNSDDGFNYDNYHSNEKNVVKFFPKPLNFLINDEWRARIFYSEVKIDNELEDSWSKYLPTNYYDVEGSYGAINALVSLKENMYYFQERGLGLLMINPVSLIKDQLDVPIKLGSGTQTIQKHYYRAIDAGTSHQWSVYRSQSTISFVDARHKKIYLFNGESVTPISDVLGQRNFVIKRLHNTLLENDNPVIDKGILTTYDYYHNEFLYTFNNYDEVIEDRVLVPDILNNENLTLAYSEVTNKFTGMYSFAPNLYINTNKYLLSTNRDNKIWFHNYGQYCNFYNQLYPSTLKMLVNDNPLYTKVFDNLIILSESIQDNVEWNDDLNIYPGSATLPPYPDDVNIKNDTFTQVRLYNQYQNTDWTTLTITPPNNNIRKVEQGFNLQIPRNKFDYDTYNPSVYSLFDPSKLTKTSFGERLRDKWTIVDFIYDNTPNLRFIVHSVKTLFRISDR